QVGENGHLAGTAEDVGAFRHEIHAAEDDVLACGAGSLLRKPVRIATKIGETNHFIALDRKSTRLNSSHLVISYAVFCLKKKHAVDVGRALHPVDQRLEAAGGARTVRAAVHRLARGLDHVSPAKRALFWHTEGLRTLRMRPRRTDDLRDYVARPLDDHRVALANILAVDVLFVVERCLR